MTAVRRRWPHRLDPEVAEFAPGLLAIQQSPPAKLPRAVLRIVIALVAMLVAWSLIARLDIVAVAEGRLVPRSYTQIVQPAEAGIVSEVLVTEGDRVERGQVLIRLDPTLATADHRTLAADLAVKRLALRRIDAELAGVDLVARDDDDPALLGQVRAQARGHRQAYLDTVAQETAARERAAHDLSAARETLAKLRATAELALQSADAHRRLVAEGFYSAVAFHDRQREAIEQQQDLKSQTATVKSLQATAAAQDRRLATVTSQYRSQLQTERTEVLGQLARLDQDAEKAGFRRSLLDLRAPQRGIVKDVATTTRGTVVQPGMVLLTLVPKDEPLVAEVSIRNDDVGFVRVGQPVRVKVAAYPFQRHGLLDGRIRHLAADAQTAESATRQPVAQGYKAVVELARQRLSSGTASEALTLEPGMQVVAEIHEGTRTVMEYLLSPVRKTVHDAARER